MAGIVLASLAGKDYVGFVDADNYVPGSVNEYVKVCASDMHLAETRFAMVRICWKSKPKVVDGALFFSRWGRTSESTNRFSTSCWQAIPGLEPMPSPPAMPASMQ